ncbi:transcriptional regulator, LysR family-like protein [Ramlibacter tataouinensis TTB310]|uniref:Transcriptional regulator, LysR family-like protein n=2 Tax=Ramlibacter tataouinensis TaxID=94132 RepID=F5Y460_RAMTT|nr:transcriptional regulator, LysR family-like protein [Ramlibacter tataouinensis TTB310]
MRVLIRVVELGSFTKAADDLQLPRATVTHAVQQLEQRLGTRLLHRTTRHVGATPDGEAYYQRCVRLLADLEEAESAFGGEAAQPRGKLRVDLQGTLARHFVLPVIGDFFERHPLVELEIGMGDRLVDLVREGVDCVLRAGELADSSMVARRVALLQQVTCASGEYLRRHGVPETLDDLRRHQAVNFLSTRTGKVMPFEFLEGGTERRVQLKGPVSVSDAEAYVACSAAHLGLIQLPRYHVAARLDEGSLREVLPDMRPAPLPVSVLYANQRQLAPRVRVFVDWLAEVMGKAR